MKNNEIVNVQADGCSGNDRYLDCSRTVNGVLATFPSTSPVFNRFGIDVCCGGPLSVEDAARAAESDPTALCSALREATFI
jgi:iron-sulfur cluster repair protein YtfE (RIC family)